MCLLVRNYVSHFLYPSVPASRLNIQKALDTGGEDLKVKVDNEKKADELRSTDILGTHELHTG